jgi:Polyketide cyclase / dehydrase and lipid transport
MASIQKQILTRADPRAVWAAIRDIGALHTRLVPGFVVDTSLEPGARIVTFQNGNIVCERIVTIDDNARRLVWSATGTSLIHHNGSAQVFDESDGSTRVVWISDLLPDSEAQRIEDMMDLGMIAMKTALDHLVEQSVPE